MGIRKTLHLGPSKDERPADPHHPHEFRAAGSNWLGGGVPPSSQGGPSGSEFALGAVGLQFADSHCVICRRAAQDPIHAPEE
jgi:hypothetical protein